MRATESRTKLLDAALKSIRTKGYAASSVEDICTAAGVTKGSFFHHFKTKDDLAIAAIEHSASATAKLYESATYRSVGTPIDRLFAYLDFRQQQLAGALTDVSEPIGMVAGEVFESHAAIRQACAKAMEEHTAMVEADIAAAMKERGVDAPWFAHTLALHMQAVFQGALVVAKANADPEVIARCVEHLRRYLEFLFDPNGKRGKR